MGCRSDRAEAFRFFRLLWQESAITEAIQLDGTGKEQLNRHSPDSRQFEARIAPLIGLGNGKFRLARARGGRSWRWRDQDC
jgi:hypothetical protein